MTYMVYTNFTDYSLVYILHLCVTITVKDLLVSGGVGSSTGAL